MTEALSDRLRRFLQAGVALLYPDRCRLCDRERATATEGYVCGRCRSGRDGVRFIRPPLCERCGLPFEGAVTTRFECHNCRDLELHFSRARAAAVARGVVLEVIHRYKYHRALWYEPFLADLLAGQAVPDLARERWDGLIPIPLYPVRQREREFNQAERLARRLAVAAGIPLNVRVLRRVQPTRTQTQLTRAERTANMRRAFALQADQSVQGQRLILIDDVLTTGATASACARVLRAGGAIEVCVWTVARGV
jgi:ComF family protein